MRKGDLSWEQTLTGVCLALAEQKAHYEKMAVDRAMFTPSIMTAIEIPSFLMPVQVGKKYKLDGE